MFGRKVQVGLDIGSHSLHWAAMEARTSICDTWSAPIFPERTSKDDVLSTVDLAKRLRTILGQAEKKTKLWNKNVVVGVQGFGVASGYLEFPPLKDAELELAILTSVTRDIPFPMDTMELVHLPVTSLTPGKTAVFYSVWKKTQAQRLRQLCEACDLRPKRMEATGIALTRELFNNRALKPDAFYAIVNLGYELTQIILVRGGYPYYLRDIPVGGRDITYAVQIGSQVSWREAEDIKRRYPLFELTHTAGPLLSELSYELSRSLVYFRKRFKVEKVEAIYLSGGSVRLSDFSDWLEEELRLPVRLDGWERLKTRQTDSNPEVHKVAVGLALGQ